MIERPAGGQADVRRSGRGFGAAASEMMRFCRSRPLVSFDGDHKIIL
jgi:hypothetical protein